MPPVTTCDARHQRLGEHPRVVDDRAGVVRERRLRRLGERHGLGGHDVGEWAAQHQRTAAVDEARRARVSQSTSPPRGPRNVLCVVVVTMCACGTGS